MTLNQRVTTVQVCLSAGGYVTSAAVIGAKIAQQSATPGAAAQQLQPIAVTVSALTRQNAVLPTGHSLIQRSEAIMALEKLTPTDAAGIQTASGTLLTATISVLADCAAARH